MFIMPEENPVLPNSEGAASCRQYIMMQTDFRKLAE